MLESLLLLLPKKGPTMNPVFYIANEQPVLPNTAQLSTAINLLRFTYLQRSLTGVESCLDANFIGTRTFSVGPSETFNKVEYCVNKENGIWNGPPPRPTMMRAGPRVGTGTQTRVFCYEFDAKGGPLGKPVLYGMDEPKTCKSYINHTNSSTKMQSLEEEVNIYVICKKDLSRVLVTDQNKDDLAMLYKEFVQLTDTKLIKS
jgi:hypothetical protein